MGLTSALNTSLNGLALNETAIDVLGNNIANAGTNGFKSSRVLFTTQLARTLSSGSRPTATNAGVNPRQIGMGATTAAISRDFSQGTVTSSSSQSDLAIQGNGFFVIGSPEGNIYTRDGSFVLGGDNYLANNQGMLVMGYGVDDRFQLSPELSSLRIPLGSLSVAEQTQNVAMGGALVPTATLGTLGTALSSGPLFDAANNPILATTLLTDVRNAAGDSLFTASETLTFTPNKGSRRLDPLSLATTGATVGDLMQLFSDAYGLQSGAGIPNDEALGVQPGVSLAGGQIQIVGNAGTINDLEFNLGDLKSDGSAVSLLFAKSQEANGASASSDFIVYDSLGSPLRMRITTVLESRTSSSTTFRYYVESPDDSRENIAIATGTLEFDSFGRMPGDTDTVISLQRDNTAAASPIQIRVDFAQITGIASEAAGSSLNLMSQDGSAPGTLTDYVIDETGVINGIFDNGAIRTMGQIALARFPNTQGLLDAGNGAFRQGVNSGEPVIGPPGVRGIGSVRAGAIELSNTDLGRNLVDLITASTNYRGNARVIGSVQQLVDELLLLGR